MVMSESKAIKKKLMAATSMLLVACIMLISASYAWFTLSTAPEITGISTAVGANGNLEIALADATTWADPSNTVETSVGNTDVKAANITWGNLVDLSDATYGLNAITLYPSRLVVNGSTGDYSVSAAPLATPDYGTDGRITQLTANTSYATYADNKFTAIADTDAVTHGVRGIGAASGMTDRQLSYRNAKIELANATAQAKAIAKDSLETNGDALANIIVERAMSEGAQYDADDLDSIYAVIEDLRGAYAEMEDAWEYAVLGYAASKANTGETGITDEEYLAFALVFPGSTKNYTVDTTNSTLTVGEETITLNATMMSQYTQMTAISTNIEAANTALEALEGSKQAPYSWSDIATPLDYIVNSTKVTINGYTKEQLKANLGALVSDVTSGKGVQVQMVSGAGVYADIADFCGNYSAAVVLKDLSYNEITVDTMNATMTTVSSVSPAYFTVAANAITAAGAPDGDGSANSALSDMYGYAIDFYLRTNASGSNLKLQVEEAQRIYSDSNNEETQGAGSNMEFTAADANFTATQMLNLMDSLRVVFMDGEGKILGVAVLDTQKAEAASSTVKADLKLCKYSFNVDDAGKATSINIEDGDTSTPELDFLADQVITSLPQNQAVKVSALVYLDGDKVDNADVATGALQSMTGKLNLQFTSDATLVPMDNSELNLQSPSEPTN